MVELGCYALPHPPLEWNFFKNYLLFYFIFPIAIYSLYVLFHLYFPSLLSSLRIKIDWSYSFIVVVMIFTLVFLKIKILCTFNGEGSNSVTSIFVLFLLAS